MTQFSAYETQYKLFRWTGMAKNDFESRVERILYSAYDIILTLNYTFFDLAYVYQLTVIAADLPFQLLLLYAMSFLMCLGVLANRFLVLGKKQILKDLYLRIRKDFENSLMKNATDADVIIEKFDLVYNRILNLFYFMGISTVLLFCMPAFLNFPDILPFPIPYSEYFNRTETLVVIIWQTLLICLGFINFISYDSIVWGFLMTIATRMEIIAKIWDQFTEEYPSTDFTKYIPEYQGYPARYEKNHETKRKYCSYDEFMRHDDKIVRETVQLVKQNVVFYQEITEEIRTVEAIYSFPLLIHMFGGAILIGITIVFVINGGFNNWYGYRTLAFFLCTIADLFVFSYYGTKVNESKDVLVAAIYGCPWHEGDVSTEKLFLFTMTMLRNKLDYTSGGLIPINLESYLSFMKLSYNLLAVLK